MIGGQNHPGDWPSSGLPCHLHATSCQSYIGPFLLFTHCFEDLGTRGFPGNVSWEQGACHLRLLPEFMSLSPGIREGSQLTVTLCYVVDGGGLCEDCELAPSMGLSPRKSWSSRLLTPLPNVFSRPLQTPSAFSLSWVCPRTFGRTILVGICSPGLPLAGFLPF